jgi:hypothetical protein
MEYAKKMAFAHKIYRLSYITYNAPWKLYMVTINDGCDNNKQIANFGESDAAQKFFSRV